MTYVTLKLDAARGVFLKQLSSLVPRLHEALYEDVFPVYTNVLKNRRAVISGWPELSVEHIEGLPRSPEAIKRLFVFDPKDSGKRFTTGSPKNFSSTDEGLDPIICKPLTDSELNIIKDALQHWGVDFKIKDGWIYQAALDTLELANVTGLKFLELQRPSLLAASKNALWPQPFTVPYNLDGTLPKPAKVQKLYKQFYDENQGKKRHEFERDVLWIIQKHFLNWSYTDIVGEHEQTTKKADLSDDAARKAIERTAEFIGFTL